jgi:hypothetical protein
MQTGDVAARERAPTQTDAFQTTDPIVDDATYDLLQALTSKLEAIEAYEQYVFDGNKAIFDELLEDERRHARRLVGALRERLSAA